MSIDLKEFRYLVEHMPSEEARNERLELLSGIARHFVDLNFGVEASQLCLGQKSGNDDLVDDDLLESFPPSSMNEFRSASTQPRERKQYE